MVSVNITCLHITYVPHSNNELCIHRIHMVHAISQQIYKYTNIPIYHTTHVFFQQTRHHHVSINNPNLCLGCDSWDGWNEDVPSSSATKCQLEECARRDDHDSCLPSVSGCVLRHILIFTKIEVSVYRNLSNKPKQQVMSQNIWLSHLGGFASLPL